MSSVSADEEMTSGLTHVQKRAGKGTVPEIIACAVQCFPESCWKVSGKAEPFVQLWEDRPFAGMQHFHRLFHRDGANERLEEDLLASLQQKPDSFLGAF